MSKFTQMTRAELRSYLFQHREDQEAWDTYFDKVDAQRDPNSKVYPADMSEEEIRQVFEEKIREVESKREQQ